MVNKSKYYILASFAIVFGWIMSFPYEGPVMYALAGEKGIDGVIMEHHLYIVRNLGTNRPQLYTDLFSYAFCLRNI